MNRVALAMTLGCGVWLIASSVESAEDPKGAKAAPPAAPPAAQTGGLSREVIEREKAIKEWRTKLSGTKWELEVVVSGNALPKVVEADVLTFDRSTVGSDTLRKAGFEDASYALYPPTEQSVEWEAMQRREEKGSEELAIWRGEVMKDTIRGTLTRQRKKGDKETTENFSFAGTLVKADQGAGEPPSASAPVPAPTPPPTTR